MKKVTTLLIIIVCCISTVIFAAELLYKNSNGIRFYRCDALGAGGRVGVKFAGNGKYRINGGFKTGMILAGSIIEAARIACDEVPEAKLPESSQNSEKRKEN